MLRVELGGHRPAADPPDVIADAVQHGLPEVGLQGAFTAHLERLQMLKRLQHRFLDNVLRVGEIAGPQGQPATRPAQQRRHAAGEEGVDGRAVAGPGPLEQGESGVCRGAGLRDGGVVRHGCDRGAILPQVQRAA